jgi:hypothetical protein
MDGGAYSGVLNLRAAAVTSTVIRHKDYDLHCSARQVDSGKYAPVLVVSRLAWPSRPRSIAVERGDHASPETAIEAARLQGVEWVAHYG